MVGDGALELGFLADSERSDFPSSTVRALADDRLATRGPRPPVFGLVGTRRFIFCSLAGFDAYPNDRPGLIHSVRPDGHSHLSVGLERLPLQPAVGALECAVHVIVIGVTQTRIGFGQCLSS